MWWFLDDGVIAGRHSEVVWGCIREFVSRWWSCGGDRSERWCIIRTGSAFEVFSCGRRDEVIRVVVSR